MDDDEQHLVVHGLSVRLRLPRLRVQDLVQLQVLDVRQAPGVRQHVGAPLLRVVLGLLGLAVAVADLSGRSSGSAVCRGRSLCGTVSVGLPGEGQLVEGGVEGCGGGAFGTWRGKNKEIIFSDVALL